MYDKTWDDGALARVDARTVFVRSGTVAFQGTERRKKRIAVPFAANLYDRDLLKLDPIARLPA